MGYFVTLPIHQLVPKFGLNAFVETGTWLGAGLACARCFSALQEFHSIELSEEFYTQARKMFEFDPRVHLYCGDSAAVLPSVKRDLDGPTSFTMAIGKSKRKHDFFWCPHREDAWHEQVVQLRQFMKSCPSAFLSEVVQREIDQILETKTPTKS